VKFAFSVALKNIKGKPARSLVMMAIVAVLAFTLFAGAFTILSLQKGLESYRTRLGADIIVIPVSATGHGSVDDIYLQGITGNYYMSGSTVEKIMKTQGISAITRQFYLTSAKASCCSTRVQIVGFDPDTDFTILPWVEKTFSKDLEDGQLVVGANINLSADRQVTFYNRQYHIAAQLERTGTGLDSAVYANMNTIRQMAEDASGLLETNPFQNVNINTAASAILIKVSDGYLTSEVADDINIHVTKVKASAARNMVSNISAGLEGIEKISRILIAAIWLLCVVILAATFILLSNERRKEFGVMRVMGASKKILSRTMRIEILIVSSIGAVSGLLLAVPGCAMMSSSIQSALSMPFLSPGFGSLAILFVAVFVVSVLTCLLTAMLIARRITKRETGLLLREDA